MNENDVLDHISTIIEKIIREVIQEILNELISKDKTFFNKIISRYLTKVNDNKFFLVKDMVLENYYDKLDDDFRLLLNLHDVIHNSKVKDDKIKWKNMIRNVISYFIHDVTMNTIKLIKEDDNGLYEKNLYFREENKFFLMKKHKIMNENSVLQYYKQNWNRRTYAMKKFVDFSETAKKLDKKIEQYIEKE